MTTRRAQGPADIPLLECISPARDKWRVRWDVQTNDDGVTSFMETDFIGKPDVAAIKATVIGWINEQTDAAILSGFTFEDAPVWLSAENRFNYKAAYDRALQSNGATLPVKFKFGTDAEPVYRTFSSLDDLSNFYNQVMDYIQATLESGWQKKDSFDPAAYVQPTSPFYFTSEKSQIAELCDWMGRHPNLGDPFKNCIRKEFNATMNYSAHYTDIMLYTVPDSSTLAS